MKEKIIKKIKEIVPADYDLLDELIIDQIADELVILIKETILENKENYLNLLK